MSKVDLTGNLGREDLMSKVDLIGDLGRVDLLSKVDLIGDSGRADLSSSLDLIAELGRVDLISKVDLIGVLGRVDLVSKVDLVLVARWIWSARWIRYWSLSGSGHKSSGPPFLTSPFLGSARPCAQIHLATSTRSTLLTRST